MTRFINQRKWDRAWARVSACLLAGLLAGCSPQPSADVLAKVGTREIRTADLRREIARRRGHGRAVPDKETLLREMIEHEALRQRALAAGLDREPQIAREMDNLLIGKLLERELARPVDAATITAAEIQAEYERNITNYTRPAKARLAILFLEAGARSSAAKRDETRNRMAEARRKFQENPEAARRSSPAPGFGALAADYSDDQGSRYRGGDLGWFDAGNYSHRWPKAVLEAGHALGKDQVSEVLESDGGFYLILKTDTRPGSVTPLAQVESGLRQSLLLKKRRGLDAAFRQEALRLAGVTVHTGALQRVELPAMERTVAKNTDAGPPAFPMSNDAPRGN